MKTITISPTPAADGAPTTPRLWPGTHQWTDDDYELFVLYFSEGSIPEIHHKPCAWDDHFILAGDPDAPFRPTLISSDDFRNHLPEVYHDTYGLLVMKLWEIARAKGFTAALEQQHMRDREDQRQQKLRGEIDALKDNFPTPQSRPPADPRQQWYAAIMAAALPDATLIEKVRRVQDAVIEGQPFRHALLQESAADPLKNTFGPLMLPESADALADPFEPEDPTEPQPRKWAPGVSTDEIVNAAARDLSELISLHVARQRVAVGYASDKESINETIRLSRSLRDLTHVIHTTELTKAKKRGRKPKPRFVNPELLEKEEKEEKNFDA